MSVDVTSASTKELVASIVSDIVVLMATLVEGGTLKLGVGINTEVLLTIGTVHCE